MEKDDDEKVGYGHPPKKYQFKKGDKRAGSHKHKGAIHFKTAFIKAAKIIAQDMKLGKEPDAVQVELIKRGIRTAMKGNYNFYRDIIDRVFGKVTDKKEIKVSGNLVDLIKNAKDTGSDEE